MVKGQGGGDVLGEEGEGEETMEGRQIGTRGGIMKGCTGVQ